MTLTEAKQYESQGWPHKHMWVLSHVPIPFVEVYKCWCGKFMVKHGTLEHVMK